MAETITITRIIKQLPEEAGITRPILCECSDGNKYYVKGQYAGKASVIHEFIAANIAELLSLPIPPYCLARLDEALWNSSSICKDIGSNPVFASRAITDASIFSLSSAFPNLFERELCQRILFFDWWLRNADRGHCNPNMLIARGKLYIIDHNNAFDGNENFAQFRQEHIFGNFYDAKCFHQHTLTQAMDTILWKLESIINMMPPEWIDDEGDISQPMIQNIRNTLLRYRTEPENFWPENSGTQP